eukprot:9550546-Alexandrium_andersonii.AAC.1
MAQMGLDRLLGAPKGPILRRRSPKPATKMALLGGPWGQSGRRSPESGTIYGLRGPTAGDH